MPSSFLVMLRNFNRFDRKFAILRWLAPGGRSHQPMHSGSREVPPRISTEASLAKSLVWTAPRFSTVLSWKFRGEGQGGSGRVRAMCPRSSRLQLRSAHSRHPKRGAEFGIKPRRLGLVLLQSRAFDGQIPGVAGGLAFLVGHLWFKAIPVAIQCAQLLP